MDADSWLLFALLILLILGGGYFAAAETAFASVNPVHIKQRAENGEKRAKRAQYILDHFNKALSSLLIGNNIMHIGTASLATFLVAEVLKHPEFTTYSTLIVTVVVFFVSEMIPKQFAKDCPEITALLFAGSLYWLMKILTPIAAFFDMLSGFITKFFKVTPEPVITEDELIEAIDSLANEEEGSEQRQQLLHSALKFDDALVWNIMTPLDAVVSISVDMKPEDVLAIIRTNKFSRLPVYKTTPSNLIGVLDVRTYIKAHLTADGKPSVRKLMQKAMTTEDTKQIDDLFDEMNQSRKHMCLVMDSEKKYVGIVTMEDILEQLVGEIYDEADDLPADLSQQGKEAAV